MSGLTINNNIMFIKEIKREANIGKNIELSNIELLVLANKWEQLMQEVTYKDGKARISITLSINDDKLTVIDELDIFMSTILKNVITLKDAHDTLFGVSDTDVPIKSEQPRQVGRISLHE